MDLDLAIERFKRAMENIEPQRPLIAKKGRTLYIVSDEAREMRRMDRIREEN
jgi:hypothetical protein